MVDSKPRRSIVRSLQLALPKGVPRSRLRRSAANSATYDQAGKTALVRVVNAGSTPVDMAINLKGVDRIESNATAVVLSGRLGDLNTLEEPQKVTPKQEAVTNVATSFRRKFPPHSFTILPLKTGE